MILVNVSDFFFLVRGGGNFKSEGASVFYENRGGGVFKEDGEGGHRRHEDVCREGDGG